MKNKILLTLISLLLFFCFFVFFKGLQNPNVYIPKEVSEKYLLNFKSQDLYSKSEINSDNIFKGNDFYLLNIWASWCFPCRAEHPILMKLSKNSKIKLIGLNYKDNLTNAKNFLNELGNPYLKNIVDVNGVISIELGAYGVPETFIIDKNKKIIKKYIGPLDKNSLDEIYKLIK
tara:strand:- start:1420 stop:1941 length:522 start_codon:yes stop_codon:yes gene_type:complete